MNKRLQAMTDNPRGNWTIADVEAVCRGFGISCAPRPQAEALTTKVAHPALREKLTIPFIRPIKPVYFRKLVAFIEAAKDLGHKVPEPTKRFALSA
jgi:hypothetical protein